MLRVTMPAKVFASRYTGVRLMRVAAIVSAVVLLSGMASCGPLPERQSLAHFEITAADEGRILDDNDSVDLAAERVAEILVANRFRHVRTSKSFGLEPWTGHTKNVQVLLESNSLVNGYISICKTSVRVRFEEIETELGSGVFAASESERAQVSRAVDDIRQFFATSIAEPSFVPPDR